MNTGILKNDIIDDVTWIPGLERSSVKPKTKLPEVVWRDIGPTFDSVLTKEVDCPDCFKQHDDIPYKYIDMLNEDKVTIGHVALGFLPRNECLAHLVFGLWSRGSFKAFKTGMFSVIIPGLKKMGIKKIVVLNSVKDKNKWTRFIKLIHFSEPQEFLYSTMEI